MTVVFRDWEETAHELLFGDVVAFENYGVEGAEIEGMVVEEENDFIKRVAGVLEDETMDDYRCYSFVSAWDDFRPLQVIARRITSTKLP